MHLFSLFAFAAYASMLRTPRHFDRLNFVSSPPFLFYQPNANASGFIVIDEKDTSIFECRLNPQ
jgi:hypothetical protein